MKTTTFLAALWAGLMTAALVTAAPTDRAAYNYYGYNPRPRPSRVYVQRAAAPQIVRARPVTPAPAIADANANAEARRTFSLEPKSSVQAPTAATGRRAYSFEPAEMVAPARAYQPAVRNRTPTYLLPKTDSRKFGGW